MVRVILALVMAAASVAAPAQSIVKCIDASGNVTYQDPPCLKGEAGRNVELPKAETREDTTAWEDAAKSAKVVRGMPKRWVLRSKGAPYEIRPPTAREDATEVWRYADRGGAAILVGFAGPNVAWVRNDANPGPPPKSAAAAPATALARAAAQGAENRKFVLPGRYCEHVFAEIGNADREEALAAPASASDAKPAAGDGAKRYFYDPTAGDPSMRTAFSCVDGKVVDVERTVVQ